MKRYRKLLGVLTVSAALLWGCAGINSHNDPDGMEAAAVESAEIPADDYEAWNALLSENDISQEFRDSLACFAFDSGSAVLSEEEGNAVFSPLSLYYALGMTDPIRDPNASGRRIWRGSLRQCHPACGFLMDLR